ncbi:MAG: twin-arginine translocation signal domain-containing protein, partial [Limisphaerales bacterium]
MQNRRDFIKTTAIAGAGLVLCRGRATTRTQGEGCGVTTRGSGASLS